MDQENKNLPEGAKLVFKGVIHDVYQWEQEMFDGRKAIFERIKKLDVSTVIAIVGDKIILSEQEQPHKGSFLSLPGGRCNKDELTIDAARRELLEETGYTSDDLFLWKNFPPPSTIIWSDDYFIARDCKKTQEPNLDNGEKIKNKLISFDEFMMLSEEDSFRHKGLIGTLLHMRLHPEEQAEFKKLLFGK